MNYNSVESILDTYENMEVIHENSSVDSGPLIVNGVDWFKFNNVISSKLYIHGDSYIGFNSNARHLQVCSRDGALWYMYREEGKLYNHYNFLKLRYEGYSLYNSTDIKYKIVYELILFDTGDMFLNVIQVPTISSYLGTSTVLSNGSKVSLDILLGTPTMISLYHMDDSGISWNVKKEIINIPLPFTEKYLIRSDNIYYTLLNGSLSIVEVEVLDAATFESNGFDKPEDFTFIKDLHNPDILRWIDREIELEDMNVKCEAMPYDQVVSTPSYDMTDQSIYGIDNITTDAINTVYQLSFDNGLTYEIYKDGSWITAADEWMTKEELEALTCDILTARGVEQYRFKMKLADDGYMKNVVVNYKNEV